VFDVVVSGPLRSIVRAHTLNWRTGDGDYELEQFYTAYTNKLYSTCAAQYKKYIPHNDGTAFGCGVRKIMNEDEFYHEGGLIVSIARNMPVIDPNPESLERNRGILAYAGVALVVKDKYQPEYQPIRSFQGNHLFRIPATGDLSYEYMVAASWSEGQSVKTPEEFKEYMRIAAVEYNNPIIAEKIELQVKKGGFRPIEYWGYPQPHALWK